MQDFNLFYFWLYRFRWNIVAFLLCYDCSVRHLLTPFMAQLKRHPFIVFKSFYFILSSFFLSEWLLLALTCCFVCKFSVEQGNTTGNHNTYIVRMKFCWNVSNETGRTISEKKKKKKKKNYFWKRKKSLVCSSSRRVYCHLFTECFHSRHLHKKPPLTQAQYVPDNKSDCGRFTGENSGRTFDNIPTRQPGDGAGSWTRFKLAIIFVFHITGAFFSCFIN